MRNAGKIFEDDFKKSVPEDVYYLRLHDSSIGFDIKNSTQRFALKSPYDVILCKNGKMFALELKSSKSTSFSFSSETSIIKRKQIENLVKAKQLGKAVAGIILNFRKYEETYFIDAELMIHFMDTASKKSINIHDARLLGKLIPQKKKKVHYRYDLVSILW